MRLHAFVHLISGSLGVGKTTFLKSLLQLRPKDEKWAVIVNEFGSVGIDGAVLAQDDISVTEVSGGCLCCLAGPVLSTTLVKLMRTHKPDRIWIETSGLAHPAQIVDELQQAPLSDALSLGACITVLDPRQFIQPSLQLPELYQEQIAIADILVSTKRDLCDIETLAKVDDLLTKMFPAKRALLQTHMGALDAVFDWNVPRLQKVHSYRRHHLQEDIRLQTQGWAFPSEIEFNADALTHLFDELPNLVPELKRAKGVFNLKGKRVWLNWVEGYWGANEVAWRQESRFELICGQEVPKDFETRLLACQIEKKV